MDYQQWKSSSYGLPELATRETKSFKNGYQFLVHKRLYYLMMHTENIQNLHGPLYMQQNNLHFTISECQLFYARDNTLKSHFLKKASFTKEIKGKEAITAFKKQLLCSRVEGLCLYWKTTWSQIMKTMNKWKTPLA